MADEAKTSLNLFYDFYAKYFDAKQHGAEAEVRFYALMSLVQVHQFAGEGGPIKGREAMRKLMGTVLSEKETDEIYDELRRESGVKDQS